MIVEHYGEGMPCWADLVCEDVAKSAAFYSALLGWEVPEGNPEFGGYANATLHGSTVAGMMPKMDPNQFPVWSTYVATPDADATVAKVEAAGGSAMFPLMDVADLGRMGVLIDPFGAVFGIWQPGQHRGAQRYKEPGAMNWIELTTDNVEGSKEFYSKVFGWTVGGNDQYTEFKVGDTEVAGMMAKLPHMSGMPNFWGVYFSVASADAAVAKITELGGQVHVPPTAISAGKFAVVADNSGTVFNILEPAS